MRKAMICMILLVFLLGWISSSLISPVLVFDKEQPLAFSFLWGQAAELESPADHITERQIHVYSDRIVLDIDDAIFAKYADTNSMDPLLDAEANGIEIKPEHSGEIQVGDVISYKSRQTPGLLVHRVVQKGVDDNGYFFVLKGDNNPNLDPEKVRFDQVNGVLVGVIY
ncbi:hypothetical protein ACFL96_05180 [Thermoproteota archaeon]